MDSAPVFFQKEFLEALCRLDERASRQRIDGASIASWLRHEGLVWTKLGLAKRIAAGIDIKYPTV